MALVPVVTDQEEDYRDLKELAELAEKVGSPKPSPRMLRRGPTSHMDTTGEVTDVDLKKAVRSLHPEERADEWDPTEASSRARVQARQEREQRVRDEEAARTVGSPGSPPKSPREDSATILKGRSPRGAGARSPRGTTTTGGGCVGGTLAAVPFVNSLYI